MPSLGVLPKTGVRTILISASTTNVNLFALAGSPSYPVTIVFKILPGVVVGSTASATPALSTGGFAAKSKIWLINMDTLIAQGGNGGNGANGNNPGLAGGNGAAGGNAMSLGCDLILINLGAMYGGGGGGGGGGSTWWISGTDGGGGGGAGQGYPTSTGGTRGTFLGGFTRDSTAGGNGNQGGPGTGGVGSIDNGPVARGGDGGNGGAYATAGNSGTGSTPADGTGGSPGAAGKAIALNGFTLSMYVTGTLVGAVS